MSKGPFIQSITTDGTYPIVQGLNTPQGDAKFTESGTTSVFIGGTFDGATVAIGAKLGSAVIALNDLDALTEDFTGIIAAGIGVELVVTVTGAGGSTALVIGTARVVPS